MTPSLLGTGSQTVDMLENVYPYINWSNGAQSHCTVRSRKELLFHTDSTAAYGVCSNVPKIGSPP